MEATMANGKSVSYVFVPPLLSILQVSEGVMVVFNECMCCV